MEEEILKQFYEVLKTETEENIRKFLIENFDKFPSEFQTAIIGALFEEALDIGLEELEITNKYLKDLISTYEDLTFVKKALENYLRQFQIKKEIEEL